MRNGKLNPKNYNKWDKVVELLNSKNEYELIQIGIDGDHKIKGINNFFFSKNMSELKDLLLSCYTWIDVDSFFQHMGYYYNKPGVVIFGVSDPNIFGYKKNINLLKDRKYLRKDQYMIWDNVEYNSEVFIDPEIVVNSILNLKF
jgi:ADP-heptose:LPS heptosyltransferase